MGSIAYQIQIMVVYIERFFFFFFKFDRKFNYEISAHLQIIITIKKTSSQF
jgi:hypothetical protein